MLMRCEGCGRMFDYEKQNGICPGCGRFCALPGPAGDTAWPGRAGALEQNGAGVHPNADGRPGQAVNTAHSARRGPAAFLALALLWLCVMAGGFALLRRQQATLPERAAFASPVADEVSGGFLQGGREVSITGAEVLGSGYRAGLAEESCLVRVGLRFGERGWRSGCGDLLYLQSGGCFYRAADRYSLGQLYPALAKNALEEDELQ